MVWFTSNCERSEGTRTLKRISHDLGDVARNRGSGSELNMLLGLDSMFVDGNYPRFGDSKDLDMGVT